MNDLLAQLRDPTKLLPLILGGIGLVFIVIGLIVLFQSQGKEEVVFEDAKDTASSSQTMVDISGAVVAPGVYSLPTDARVHDALIAAGGLSVDADREWVAKTLNLAARVTDGAKIYIPEKGQSSNEARSANKVQNFLGTSTAVQTDSLININTASQSELEVLPGVGPVTATKIIDNRPFTDVGDLLSKKVVGQKVFDQIKDRISVY